MFGVGFNVELPHEHSRHTINHNILTEASRLVAGYAADVWRSAVSGVMLPGMTQPVVDEDYAKSIRVSETSDGEFRVSSTYDKAERIENGYPAFDMKPGLLRSGKAKPTKDGLGMYVTIPFRSFTTPGKGMTRRVAAPPDILSYVRQYGHLSNDDTTGQRTKAALYTYGGAQRGGVMREQVSRGSAPAPMTAPYTWKTGQYAGMTKVTTPGGSTRYMNYRRVSTQRSVTLPDGRVVWRGSDPNAWIHPGQQANPIMGSVERYIEPFIEEALTALYEATER